MAWIPPRSAKAIKKLIATRITQKSCGVYEIKKIRITALTKKPETPFSILVQKQPTVWSGLTWT